MLIRISGVFLQNHAVRTAISLILIWVVICSSCLGMKKGSMQWGIKNYSSFLRQNLINTPPIPQTHPSCSLATQKLYVLVVLTLSYFVTLMRLRRSTYELPKPSTNTVAENVQKLQKNENTTSPGLEMLIKLNTEYGADGPLILRIANQAKKKIAAG